MIDRHILPGLRDALRRSPVVFLSGARQTGKSTLVQHLAAGTHPAQYLTLDDLPVLAAARQEPAGFVAGLQGPVILDEVQRAPELFLPIKAAVDRNRRPGRFLLTGSANVLRLPRLAETLTGRMEILTLEPFSQGELEAVPEKWLDAMFARHLPSNWPAPTPRADGLRRMLIGGYPPAVAARSHTDRRAWFDSYIATLLQRDVRDLANIEGLTDLPRLLSILAARCGSLLNHAELARASGFAQSTLKRYMTLLEAVFLVQPIPAWSANLTKRLVKSAKLMLGDTGLASRLLDLTPSRLASQGHLVGPVLENFVVAELRKQASWSRTRPRLYHFRAQSGQEVDVVLEDSAGRCVGIEVKAAAGVTGEDFAGLKALIELLGAKFHRGVVLYTGESAVPFASNLHALPLSTLWQVWPT